MRKNLRLGIMSVVLVLNSTPAFAQKRVFAEGVNNYTSCNGRKAAFLAGS